MRELTDAQQAWVDRLIDAQNAYDSRSISADVCPSCARCQSDFGLTEQELEEGEVEDKGGYSLHDCECCGSSTPGDRFSAHALNKGHVVHLSVCEDCMLYLSSGYVPGQPE